MISVLVQFNSEIQHDVSNKKQPNLLSLDIITMNSHAKTNGSMKRQQTLKTKQQANKIVYIQI